MTCGLCEREDSLQVLSEEVCRSCMDSLARGVHIHIDLYEDQVTETIPGTSFLYSHRVRWKHINYILPLYGTAALN